MRRLLALAALLEAVTGLALMFAPSVVSTLLLGEGASGAGSSIGRVAGIALLSLGLACWPGRDSAIRPAMRAMLTYNPLVACYLIFLGIEGERVGILLWPGAALHGLVTLLLVREQLRIQHIQDTKG